MQGGEPRLGMGVDQSWGRGVIVVDVVCTSGEQLNTVISVPSNHVAPTKTCFWGFLSGKYLLISGVFSMLYLKTSQTIRIDSKQHDLSTPKY